MQRWLHLVAICGVAVAQPLYDITGRYPAFFVAHAARPRDLFLLIFFASLLLPTVLLAIEQLAGLISRRVGDALHFLFIAGGLALFTLQALRTVPASGIVVVVVSLAAGVIATVLYHRSGAVKTLISVLAIGGVAFPLLFIMNPDIRKIAFPRAADGRAPTHEGPTSDVPVIMVVFDELPLLSLLDSEGQIDAGRFPNLARLASTSVWYRNTTAVSDATALAIPAILNGSYPATSNPKMPIYQDHPVTLFTLLEGSHDLYLFEHFTRMAPPGAITSGARSQRGSAPLVRDLGIVYLHMVLPPAFTHRLPPITEGWKDFGNAQGALTAGDSHGEEQDSEVTWADFKGDWARRGQQFDEFLEAINRGERPGLFFIHSMLPHAAWEYLPNGKGYSLQPEGAVIGAVGANTKGIHPQQWVDDEWVLTQAYQRHLLQVGFVDTLVGRMIARAEAAGIFDEALIIVTADHGVSFRPGDNRRQATATNAGEILPVPLLIKLPAQREGRVVQTPATLVDVLPTVADILDVTIPGAVDGHSLLETRPQALPRDARLVSEGGRSKVFTYPLPGWDRTLRTKLETFGEGPMDRVYQIGPFPQLRGMAISTLPIGDPIKAKVRIRGQHLYAAVQKSSKFVPTDIRGVLSGADAGIFPIAVAVNGTIAALTNSYRAKGGGYEFTALVPERSLREGPNAIEVFAIESGKNEEPILRPIPGSMSSAPSIRYSIAEGADGDTLLKDGRPLEMNVSGWAGWVVSRMIAGGDMVEISGWAGNVADGRVGEIVLFSDGRFIASTDIHLARPEIAAQYKKPSLIDSGFSIVRPYSQFSAGEKSALRLFVVSENGEATELNYPTDPSRWNFAMPPAEVAGAR